MVDISGGQKVEAYFRDLARKVSKPGTLKMGFLANATYPDGTSVALVAALNEFGTAKAPPRPFFRNMVASKSRGWGPAAAALLKSTNYDVLLTLKQVGEGIKGQLQQSIASNTPPPNAPSTIARKGHGRTLIDTGHMLNSVDYEVTMR